MTAERELQRRLWDGGFAGICFPAEYGGLGLTTEHQRRSTRSRCPTTCRSRSTSRPSGSSPPPWSTSAPTSRRRATCPAILKGEELWVQFLSEPSGGSGPGRLPHPGRPRRRRLRPERLEDLELGGRRRRLRHVPRPHQLGRAEAPRPHDVHREDPPARRHRRADPPGRRLHGVLPGVLRRRRRSRRPTSSARSTTAGRSPPGSSCTSGTRSAAGRPTRAVAPAGTTPDPGDDALVEVGAGPGPTGDPSPGSWSPRPTSALVGGQQLIGRSPRAWPRARCRRRRGRS